MARRRKHKRTPGGALARLRAMRRRFDSNKRRRHSSNRRRRHNPNLVASFRSIPTTGMSWGKAAVGGLAGWGVTQLVLTQAVNKFVPAKFQKGWAGVGLNLATGAGVVMAANRFAKRFSHDVMLGAMLNVAINAGLAYKSGELKVPGMKEWADTGMEGLEADEETAYPWGVDGVDDFADSANVRAAVMQDYAGSGNIRAAVLQDYAGSGNIRAAQAMAEMSVDEEMEELS